ncbi:MAG: PD40 domain-containing protein, partial [Flavobacteriales bacterium]|nr:PD40 domain-containing protein [Flavobacteriales bacterium]
MGLLTVLIAHGQDNGFISKSNKTPATDNGFKNKWGDAKKDSLSLDSTAHTFGSYNFRDDKDIPYRAKRQIHKGDLFFNLGPGKYDRAMKHYKKAYKIDPNIAYVDFKVGQCYLLLRNNKFKSILYLEKAFRQNKRVSKEIHYYLGRAHQVNHDYPGAIEEYEKSKTEYRKAHRKDHISLAEKHAHNKLIEKRINECKFAMLLKDEPKKVLIENVGDSVNTSYSEYDPFITADGSMMMYTSRRKGTRGGGKAEIDHVFYEDLYVSYNKNGLWSKAVPMKNKFNKHTNDAIIGLSHDGKEMFVYRDTKQGDIYLSERENDTWGKPKPIKVINTGYHESSACFSFDKKSIYFVSDKPGGYGGRDIYQTNKQEDGTWGTPESLGRKINTEYDEERVYLHPNGKILFFASQGHNSMGGYDIFFSKLDENGNWGEPENIGYPINGPDDEISFVINAEGDRGYFSSYRPYGLGDRDIYLIRFGLSSKIGNLNREDDLLSKKKVMTKKEFIAELIEIGIDPLIAEDVLPILPDETMENLHDMIDLWDAEIAELLSLLDSTTNKKEILNLEQQVKVKRKELIVLDAAANPDEFKTLEQQITLREEQITSLRTQIDSTTKKKEIKNLEDRIKVQQNELALLQSAYVRGEETLADDNFNLDQSISVNASDSLAAQSNLNLSQSTSVSSADSLTAKSSTEVVDDERNISNDSLFIVEYEGQYTVYSEDKLGKEISAFSSNITKENIVLNNLKKEMAMATDNQELARLEQKVEVEQGDIVEMKIEMDALLSAKTVTETLAEDKIKTDEITAINSAVEKAKIEISANETVTTATIEEDSSTTANINLVETQSTTPINGNATVNEPTPAITISDNDSTNTINETADTSVSGQLELADNKEINLQNSSDVQELEKGSSMVLENVLFDFDKSTLRPESYEALDKLVAIMAPPPATSKVELSGHT